MTSRRTLLAGLPAMLAGRGRNKPMMPGNPAFGGTVLRIPAEQSPNFVTGVSGWYIGQDGSAQFNNIIIRGGQVIGGTELDYNGTPAAGNLVYSRSQAGGTDSFGNVYLGGVVEYQKVSSVQWSAIQIQNNNVTWYTATSYAGPWTQQAQINTGSGGLEIVSNSTLTLDGVTGTTLQGQVTATGGTPANPTLITTDSGTLITLDAGWTVPSGYFSPAYILLPDGHIGLAGCAGQSGTVTSNKTLNSANPLPAQYRPASSKLFRSFSGPGARGAVQLDPTGIITMLANATYPAQYCEIDAYLALV